MGIVFLLKIIFEITCMKISEENERFGVTCDSADTPSSEAS